MDSDKNRCSTPIRPSSLIPGWAVIPPFHPVFMDQPIPVGDGFDLGLNEWLECEPLPKPSSRPLPSLRWLAERRRLRANGRGWAPCRPPGLFFPHLNKFASILCLPHPLLRPMGFDLKTLRLAVRRSRSHPLRPCLPPSLPYGLIKDAPLALLPSPASHAL